MNKAKYSIKHVVFERPVGLPKLRALGPAELLEYWLEGQAYPSFTLQRLPENAGNITFGSCDGPLPIELLVEAARVWGNK